MMPAWAAALTPGLLVVVVAIVLDRWLRVLGIRIPLPVWAAFAVVLLILLGPVLVGGRTALPLDVLRGEPPFSAAAPWPAAEQPPNPLHGDLVQLVAPAELAVREALLAGRWPLWQERVGAGMPLLADPQAQAMQPLLWLTLPLGFPQAAGVLQALRVLCALVFFFALLRHQGLPSGASACGALAWGLGGFLGLWRGWPMATVAALLPAVLLAMSLTWRQGRRRDQATLVAVGAALLCAGHPQTVLYAVLFAGGWGVGLWREQLGGEKRRAARLAFCLAAAAGLSAPALLPFLDYLPQTRRAQMSSWPFAGVAGADAAVAAAAEGDTHSATTGSAKKSWARAASESFVQLLDPNALGNDRYATGEEPAYWGRSNINEDASAFTGSFALLAVLFSLGRRRRFAQERLVLWWGAGALVLALLPAHALTGFGANRLLLFVNLALAYACACAVARASEEARRPRLALALGVALAITLTAALWLAPAEAPRALWDLRFGWFQFQMKILVAAALWWAFAGRERWAPAAAAFLVAAELLTAHAPAYPTGPQLDDPRVLPDDPALVALRLPKAAGRSATLGVTLPPNAAALWGVADVRVYSPMAPARYLEWLRPLLVAPRGNVDRLARCDDPRLDALGTRRLLEASSAANPSRCSGQQLLSGDGWIVLERPGAQPLITVEPDRPLALRRDDAEHWTVSLTPAAVGESALPSVHAAFYQDGNWRALADLQATGVSVSSLFVETPLLAETKRVDFLYRSRAHLAGCLLAALALAALGATWVAQPRAKIAA